MTNLIVEGRVVRKKRRYDWLVFSIRENRTKINGEDEIALSDIYVDRRSSSPFKWMISEILHLESIIRVHVRKEKYSNDGKIKIEKDKSDNIDSVNKSDSIDDKERNRNNDELMFAKKIDLIQCAPTPKAVEVILEGIFHERKNQNDTNQMYYRPSILGFEENNVHHDLFWKEIEKALSSANVGNDKRQKRNIINKIIRQLKGLAMEKPSRHRPPHTKYNDLQRLDQLESMGKLGTAANGWKLVDPIPISMKYCTEITKGHFGYTESKNQEHDNAILFHHNYNNVKQHLNLPSSNVKVKISNSDDQKGRLEYLVDKKQPQVRWIIRRIQALGLKPKHIIDVGGGRGDLATALASAMEDSIVTVVDMNESSLAAGKEYAKKVGCNHRMNFVHADFYDFIQNIDSHSPVNNEVSGNYPVDLVVALHACGDLSDLALTFAKNMKCPFLICPCCYTKRYLLNFHPDWRREQFEVMGNKIENDENANDLRARDATASILGRLAEMDGRRDISYRAMAVINSMRLHCMHDSGYQQLRLEQYDGTCSSRNIVLVGVK